MKLGWSVGARLMRWAAALVLNVVCLYALTGRRDLPWVWATMISGSIIALVVVLTIDPELVRERRKPGPGAVDVASRRILPVVYVAQIIVACLDVGRLHWSDGVPAAVHALGLAANVLGFGLIAWSLRVNRYFSSVVRIQTDRGHELVTTGPYGVVRHPGYLGMLLAYPTTALALGSWWAVVPGVLCALVVLRRAALEDRYLQQNLAGYADYVPRVPYRLIPGVW
ncbi:MAG: hypothetical protein AUH78_27575 [Gemmatimonadetes bacterium 13_1_40CM_4_69_8]|nr:MAG: hypothetical protein AUH78_27575 [Gemmatimonadetes bacterium 13_1_40CM_4_69_8]